MGVELKEREDYGWGSALKALRRKDDLEVFFIGFLLLALLFFPEIIYAKDISAIKLLAPQLDKGRPLMQVLKERKSQRDFSPKVLPLQVLSDLLWAAFGINRPESGKRTAPSAVNMQEIDIYVAGADGLYLYDAINYMLIPVLAKDIRAMTGIQPFVKDAAVNLIYVADFSRMQRISPEVREFYATIDTGFICQNVYLFCASEGLACVVRGLFDAQALGEAMKLRPQQKLIITQSVGYPKQK
jgi:SagB-type dehydrogenase family enzyme